MSRRISRRAAIGGALGLFGLAALPRLSAGRRLPQSRALNVLIVVLDTVRRDRFAANGGALAPALNRFMERGVRFTNAWAPSSWSLPSQATILTGAHPHEHGADWPELALKSSTPTLAERLAARGYVTGAFSSNASWTTPEYLGHGFLRFKSYTFEDHLRRTTQGRLMSRVAQAFGSHPGGRGRKAPTVNAQFLSFIDRYPDRPFFAYLCHMDVNQSLHHAKLNRPFWAGKAATADIVAAYDRGLATLDAQMADLLSALETRGTLDRTIVVIASDHGESFGPDHPGDHLPIGHGSSLFPEQTRVPLAVVAPGGPGAGRVVDAPVSLKAIPATVARLVGVEAGPGRALPMEPDWPIAPDPALLMTLRYSTYHEDALVTPRWLYRRDVAAGSEALYDLQADPAAQSDLGVSHPDMAALRARSDRILREGTAAD
jgi:arylsulfatase A-like enzyme